MLHENTSFSTAMENKYYFINEISFSASNLVRLVITS